MTTQDVIALMLDEIKYLKSLPSPNSDTKKWAKELELILQTAQAGGLQADLATFKYSLTRTPIPEKNKARSIEEKIEAENYVDLLTFYHLYVGQHSLITEFFDQKFLDSLGQTLEDEFYGMDKETLVHTALEYAFGNEFLSRKCDVLLERIKYLQGKLDLRTANRLVTAKKKGAARNKNFQSDTDFATNVYTNFISQLNRPVVAEDYDEFVFRVREGRPIPHFIPKPKLTAEERAQNLEDRQIARDGKERREWSEARLRKLFMKLSGLSSTKKHELTHEET